MKITFRHPSLVTLAAFFVALATPAYSQNSQFAFDATGNLLSAFSESPALPQITGQPQMQVVIRGETASFSVSVADTLGVSYQWYFNSSAIPGATSDSLLLTNVSSANEGPYFVAVSNAFGSVASVLANLYIDSRGCGMPDSWQFQYFGNLNQPATGDYDGDGVSNLQEFLDGTNPTNAASALYRITLLNDGGSVVISPDQPTYTNGQIVMLTATSTNSNPFHAWTGDVTTRSNSITVTMTNNMNLFARFLSFTLAWTNTQNGDWNVASSWSPNLIPGENESVLIANQTTVTENSNVDLVDLTLGSSFIIAGLAGTGTVTIAGNCFWYNGTMSGGGATIVKPGASLSMANSLLGLSNNRTLENAGMTVWVGGNFEIGGIITNDPGALFEITGPASFNLGGGTARFDNAGAFIIASNAATTFAAGVALDNYGTLTLGGGGTLTMAGGGVQAAPIVVPAGSAISFQGGIFTSTSNLSLTGPGEIIVGAGTTATLAGTVNLAGSNIFSGGSVHFTGYYTCTNNTMLISGGIASFDGTGIVSPAFLTLNGGGYLGGGQTVTVLNAMNWTGGSMSGTGWTIIPPGVTLSISNSSPISMTSRTLDNAGTVVWDGASTMSMSGGVITNESGASFTMQNPFSFNGGNGARFDNAGVVRAAPGGGTISVSAAFYNYNDIQIQNGTLELGGGGLNNGTIEVPAGTTLSLTGGAFNANPASSITGAGAFTVNFANATLAGLLNVTGTNTFSNGTADMRGNYICTNNTLVISGAIAYCDGTGAVSPQVLNLSGGTFGGSQSVTVGSAMNWTGGTLNGSGRTFIPPGAALNIACTSPLFITSYTLENGGSATWTGTSLISMNGGVITNDAGASFTIQNPLSLNGGNGARFDNAGVARVAPGGGTISVSAAFNNYNDTQIQSGTLQLGGGLNNGTIEVPAGTALNIGGAFTSSASSSIAGAGTLQVSGGTSTLAGTVNLGGSNVFSGGSVDFTGNYICMNNTMVISGGAASFDGTGVVSPSVINLSGFGSLGGTQTVTAASVMSWTGGTMSGTGRTIIPSGATLSINNPSTIFITSRTLENRGVTTWTGAGGLSMNGGVITNRAGALFNPQNATTVGGGGGTPRFDNAGVLRKSVSPGTLTFENVPLANYGTVDIETGVLLTYLGGYVSASNAVLNCALAGTTPGTNYGQLQVSGSVTLAGTLSVNLTNNYSPATNDTFTVLTAGTRNGTFANFVYPSNRLAIQLSNTTTSVILRVTNVFAVPQPLLLPPQLSGSNITLTWTTVPNTTYRVEFNPSLAPSNWSALPGDVTSQSNLASKLDVFTPSNRFYRVLVLP